MTTPSDPALKTKDAAAYLACSTETVRRAIARGHLTAERYGRVLRIRQSELDRFVAANRTTGADQLAPRRRRHGRPIPA